MRVRDRQQSTYPSRRLLVVYFPDGFKSLTYYGHRLDRSYWHGEVTPTCPKPPDVTIDLALISFGSGFAQRVFQDEIQQLCGFQDAHECCKDSLGPAVHFDGRLVCESYDAGLCVVLSLNEL